MNKKHSIYSVTVLLIALNCLSFSAFAKNLDLVKAVNASELKTVKKLLKTKKDANTKDNNDPLLYVALVDGNIEIAEFFILKGADPNATNQYGAPVLLTAAGSGYDNIVKLLIEKGAKIDARFKRYDNVTALMLAAQDGHISTVDVLLKNGADVNAETTNGDTALIAATANGHLTIIEKLLKKGADIDVRSETGYTALFVAISEDNAKLVEMLLVNGADPNVRDNNDDSPLSFASRIENEEIIRMIKSAGGK